MLWAVTFHNPATGKPEAVLFKTRADAQLAIATAWFSVYDCTLMEARFYE